MSLKPQLNQLLNKTMDRQDFIKHIAIGVTALSGAGAALRLLSAPKQKSVGLGYGDSAYGGSTSDKKLG